MEDKAENRVSIENVDTYFLTVSHELKAPLTEISAYAKIIEEDCAGILPEQSRKDLEAIRRICSNAMSMLCTYMDYASIQTMEINLERICLRDLMQEIFHEMTDPLRDRKFTLLLPEEVPDVIADRFLFSLLLKNILANSIKFTASREEAVLCFRYCRKEDVTLFFFEDNGEGVNEEFARRAFNLFEKSDMEDNAEGSGIGLNLVRRIAERFQGDVSISSVEGESFSIEVRLPSSMIVMPDTPGSMAEYEKSGEIRIGVIGAITGDYSEIAPCRRHAYELAVDEINASGGILGKKVKLYFRIFTRT